ncbi:GNAT family N-acetyltransferase [Peribacillus kribbensis]|uniref:GNAT family N-acetyltransferase n=1 Tax=Peribacillus kribbensis TaxID=356658 RepID=UPI0004193B87|nr:GNAT family N-acetyltransferase [Peribacillus kribbensis]
MKITIERILYEKKAVLRKLMELYQYDFSEYTSEDVNEWGEYGYRYMDHYWTEETRFPYFIKADGNYAGFALVREIEDGYSMAEFFILKKYRRNGAGRQAATAVFEQHLGVWKVSVIKENLPAKKFWRKTITIYTGGNFKEAGRSWEGAVFTFRS